MQRSCEAIREQLTHFVLAQLDADETLAVVRHLASCADCAREETSLRDTSLMLRRFQNAPVPESAMERARRAGLEQLSRMPRQASIGRAPAEGVRSGLRTLTWAERWESLLDAMRLAQRRVAPFAFATIAAATLCAVLVLLRDPHNASRSAAVFLAGMWCASVANGVIGLASGETGARDAIARRLQIDLRATALSAMGAGGCVAALFVIVGIVKALWLGEFLRPEALRVVMYSVASFLLVSAVVATFPHQHAVALSESTWEGRISGALVAVIYSAIAAPLIYIVIGFRMDWFWVMAQSSILVFAIAGGLVGDFLAARRSHAM